jgi:hypothetical protein
MDTWRIIVNLINRSNSVKSAPASGIGATVIPAKRGKGIPVKIQKGQTSRILQLYGNDSYHVLEAIAYNDKYPLWICSPHSNGIQSALMLTDNGLENVPLLNEEINFSQLLTQHTAARTQAGIASYATILPHYDKLAEGTSIRLTVGSEPHLLTLTPDDGTVLITSDVGEGTLDPATGAVEFTFTNAPASGTRLGFRYNLNVSEIAYAIFGMAFPCEDFLALSIKKSDISSEQLSLGLAEVSKGVYSKVANYPIEISLEQGHKDGAGKLIFVEQLLKDNDLLFAKINEAKPFDPSVWDVGSDVYTDFAGGSRGDPVTDMEITAGWQKFKSTRLYPADIYFDTTGAQSAKAAMISLRNGPIPYKRFLAPVAEGFPSATEALQIESIPSNRGLSVFWNGAYIQNPFTPTGDLLSTLMGEVAAKFADALVYSYGGRAVSWGDENNVGGQLTGGRIVRMLHDASSDETKEMDKKRINPIIQQELFGPMIASRRTTDTSESDYSYTDYSAIVDYCVERLVNEVLPYQITKFNDDVHRADVGTRAELIIKPLTVSPNNVIREYALKCDTENNDDEVMARQEFILTVGIKVTPKSEIVILNFINTGQTMRVEELMK